MVKWLAGIAAAVIAGLIILWISFNLQKGDPALNVTAWYAPEPMEIGKAIDISVKVRSQDDRPVSGVAVALTPVAGTFTWADTGGTIKGQTNQEGLFSTKYQTVVRAGVIGGGPAPGNSRTGKISILASKEGYKDSGTMLEITAVTK